MIRTTLLKSGHPLPGHSYLMIFLSLLLLSLPLVNYPTSAVEILDLLREQVAILSGGRDKQSQSIITFPAKEKGHVYQRDTIRRVVQYLACIPV